MRVNLNPAWLFLLPLICFIYLLTQGPPKNDCCTPHKERSDILGWEKNVFFKIVSEVQMSPEPSLSEIIRAILKEEQIDKHEFYFFNKRNRWLGKDDNDNQFAIICSTPLVFRTGAHYMAVRLNGLGYLLDQNEFSTIDMELFLKAP